MIDLSPPHIWYRLIPQLMPKLQYLCRTLFDFAIFGIEFVHMKTDTLQTSRARQGGWWFEHWPGLVRFIPQSWLVRCSGISLGGGAPGTGLSLLWTWFSGGSDLWIGGSGWRAVWLCRAWRLLVAAELSGCCQGVEAALVEPSLGGSDLGIGGALFSSGARGMNSLGEEPRASVTWSLVEAAWCRLWRKETERGL